jgi:hypothetical protein
LNYRAGWGYMLLTNFLPHASGGSPGGGNGIFTLHVLATNKTGQIMELGTKTIIVDNAHASKPFGTIDTPGQGATVAGNAYVNFGWALTQNPNCIASNGSTINVYVDGLAMGHPVYNQSRSDIASLFPGLCNTNGAVGFFYIDTTTLANGVHTISWAATDNAGHSDGLGSRYFTVANAGGVNGLGPDEAIEPAPRDALLLRRNREEPKTLGAGADGVYEVETEELGLIELHLGAAGGHSIAGGQSGPLPVGSTLQGGVFYWHAALGFLGDYPLVFERPDGSSVRVQLRVVPKGSPIQ